MTYSIYDWTHDGRPYRAQWCDVFSDGASERVKRTAGEFADAQFEEVMGIFGFQEHGTLRYPPGFPKIDVYINRYHSESIAAAYWGSVFLTVRTDDLDTGRYRYLFRHELTHQFEFLIEGTVNLNTDVWFREGIAIVVGGGLGRITDEADLAAWLAQNAGFPNQGNPISIHQWDDFPEGADVDGYYGVFDAVMRYLLDPRGLDRSPNDILDIFYAVRDGEAFSSALDRTLGIGLTDLEADIFQRLSAYLGETAAAGGLPAGSPLFQYGADVPQFVPNLFKQP